MADQEPAFKSEVTYHNPATKKWENGFFILNKNSIQFVVDDDASDQFHLHLPLNTISGIEKKQSSLIFACIVVTVGSEKHWFSSFPNRDAAYNMFELFWREALFCNQYKTVRAQKTATTKLGQELLTSLHESECILVETSNALLEQGQQLDNAQEAVEELNNSLDHLEMDLKSANLVKSFANISLLKDSEKKDEMIKKLKRYKVMFSFTKALTNNNNWNKGELIFSNEISLLDESSSTIQMQILLEELESFQILTPWEMCINSKTTESKSCYLMCPQLSRLLKYLYTIPLFKAKIIFSDSRTIDDLKSNSNTSVQQGTTSDCNSGLTKIVAPMKLQEISEKLESVRGTTQNTALSDDTNETIQQELSEEDAQAIFEALQTVQKLATDIQTEELRQLEKINSLVCDMANTELRFKADDDKLKKMI